MGNHIKKSDEYRSPNQNPWYVLATLYGEISYESHVKNRAAWNAWIGKGLSKNERVSIINKRFSFRSDIVDRIKYDVDEINAIPSIEELSSWEIMKDEILIRFQQQWRQRNGEQSTIPELPDPLSTINLSSITFHETLMLSGFIFIGSVNFAHSTFIQGLHCKACLISGNISLKGSKCIGTCDFELAYIAGCSVFDHAVFQSLASYEKCIFTQYSSFLESRFNDAQFMSSLFIGRVDFSRARINRGDFRSTKFMNLVRYVGTEFIYELIFDDAIMFCDNGEYADYTGAIFGADVSFRRVIFKDSVLFRNSNFIGQVFFSKSEFHGISSFNGVQFGDGVSFNKVHFHKKIDASSVCFMGETTFNDAVFHDVVNFSRSVFENIVYFDLARFCGNADNYAVIFENCRFAKSISFREARFLVSYPVFTGAVLPDDIYFTAIDQFWPRKLYQNKTEARQSVSRIRYLVDKQGFFDDAHFFYRLEMSLSRHIGTFSKRLPFLLYGFLSNYGVSISRPVVLLCTNWLLGFLFIFISLNFNSLQEFASGFLERDIRWPDYNFTLPAGVSLANSVPFLGMNRLIYGDFFKETIFIVKIISITQSFLSVIFMFLLALAFRTRFRVK